MQQYIQIMTKVYAGIWRHSIYFPHIIQKPRDDHTVVFFWDYNSFWPLSLIISLYLFITFSHFCIQYECCWNVPVLLFIFICAVLFFFNRSYTISYSADITILSSANCLDFCIRKILISERTMRRPLCTVMRDRRWSWPIVVWKEHTHTIYLHT